MAKLVKKQNGGAIDASGWTSRPAWKGIVFFEGAAGSGITGHVDLWAGTQGIHGTYSDWGGVIWFWKLGSSPNELLLGNWVSKDSQHRWSLSFAEGACLWTERNSAGKTLSRSVYPS
jgi:hypothetical protein